MKKKLTLNRETVARLTAAAEPGKADFDPTLLRTCNTACTCPKTV